MPAPDARLDAHLTCGANRLCSPLPMTKSASAAIVVLAACLGASALAGPAPWYQWRSKIDGKMVCAQTSLGRGWEPVQGPFRDSHCKYLITK